MNCTHGSFERVRALYVDGRPLYRCLDCDVRFTFEDEDQSFKGLVSLKSPPPGAGRQK